MKANFICPFDLETRQTTLPMNEDGQYICEAVHVTPESEKGTVVCQVRADVAVIEAMKADKTYQWLEDIAEPVAETETKPDEEKPEEPVEVAPVAVAEPADVKVAVTEIFDKADVDKLTWATNEDAIKSVCALHKQPYDYYRVGGIG